MSSYYFDSVKLKVAKAQLNFDVPDGAFKMALVTSAVFDNFSTGYLSDSNYWYELSAYEITEDSNYNSTGYTGHQDIDNIGFLEVDSNGFTDVYVSATDIVFPISTMEANGAVIYKNDTDKTLIVAIDFGGRIVSSNGLFKIDLSTNGFTKVM